jgi:hypothetical protein
MWLQPPKLTRVQRVRQLSYSNSGQKAAANQGARTRHSEQITTKKAGLLWGRLPMKLVITLVLFQLGSNYVTPFHRIYFLTDFLSKIF